MPTFRLDFEEWHELYLAAQAVPENERRPCLATAILGLERVLSECTVEDPDTATAIMKEGAHACDVTECQKALESALAALASGVDPFEATATEEEEDDVIDRLNTIETKIDRLLENPS